MTDDFIGKLFSADVSLCFASDADPASRFWVIPGKQGQPRWIIPQTSRLGLPVLERWAPCELPSRMKWRMILLAYRMGFLGQIPGITSIGLQPESKSWLDIWQGRGWDRPECPVPVIYVGTPGLTRKLVVTLVGSVSAEPESVLKVPLTAEAAERTRHESFILSNLSDFNASLGPEALFCNQDTGWVTQRYLDSMPTGRKLREEHINWLLKLRKREEFSDNSPLINLHKRFTALFQKPHLEVHRESIQKTLDMLEPVEGLPRVWEHGDFVSWNIRRLQDGHLILVDWEESEMDGLPMQDLFYFDLIWDVLAGRPSSVPDRIEQCALYRQYMKVFNLNGRQAQNLYRYCRLRLLFQKLVSGDPSMLDRAWRSLAL